MVHVLAPSLSLTHQDPQQSPATHSPSSMLYTLLINHKSDLIHIYLHHVHVHNINNTIKVAMQLILYQYKKVFICYWILYLWPLCEVTRAHCDPRTK